MRDKDRVPADLIFDVSYLGGDMPTLGLNFSRPGAQVLLQYYMFLRLGYDGFRKVQQATQDVAHYLSGQIAKIPALALWNDGSDIPVFAWRHSFTADSASAWRVFLKATSPAKRASWRNVVAKRASVNTIIANPFANMALSSKIRPKLLTSDAPS